MAALGVFLFGAVFGALFVVVAGVLALLSFADKLQQQAERDHVAAVNLARSQRDSRPPVSATEDISGSLYLDSRPPPLSTTTTTTTTVDSSTSSTVDAQPLQPPPKFHALLRVNTLFLFPDETSTSCAAAMCLDGCTVALCKTRPSRYHRRNYLRLTAIDGRELHIAQGVAVREAFCWCETGLDLERWFEGISLATRIAHNPNELRAQLDAFARIGPACMHVSSTCEPLGALNALVHRIWWPTHDSDFLGAFMRAKVDKKLARLKKPSLVTDLRAGSVTFGPNMPIATSAKLVSVTPSGGITIDADVEYAGGFAIEILCRVSISLPMKRQVSVPLVIAVSVGKSTAKARLVLLPPPARKMWLGFHEEPNLELSFDTHVAQHASISINVVPKIAGMIIAKLRQEIVEMLVLPMMDDYPIPTPKRTKPPKTAVQPPPSPSQSPSTTSLGAPVVSVSAPATPTTSPAPPVIPQRPVKPTTITTEQLPLQPQPAAASAAKEQPSKSAPTSPAGSPTDLADKKKAEAMMAAQPRPPPLDLAAALDITTTTDTKATLPPPVPHRQRTGSAGAKLAEPPKASVMSDDTLAIAIPPRPHHVAPARPPPPKPPVITHRQAPPPPPAPPTMPTTAPQ